MAVLNTSRLMTWSYSRITSFEACPYGFYIKYIDQSAEDHPKFFSEYGSLMHEILADYYSGKATSFQCKERFMTQYVARVPNEAPNDKMWFQYFMAGLTYTDNLSPIDGEVLDIEKFVSFKIGALPFVGIVDMIYMDADGRLTIVDHKSRTLEPRKGRKSDAVLDELRLA